MSVSQILLQLLEETIDDLANTVRRCLYITFTVSITDHCYDSAL